MNLTCFFFFVFTVRENDPVLRAKHATNNRSSLPYRWITQVWEKERCEDVGRRNALSEKTIFVNNFSKKRSYVHGVPRYRSRRRCYRHRWKRISLPYQSVTLVSDRINFIVHASRYDKRHPPLPNSARRSLPLGPVAAPMPNRSRFARAGPGLSLNRCPV